MSDSPIVVIDSGIGGLPYLARIRRLLPDLPTDYVADSAHFPYGDRTDSQVIDAVLETAERVHRRLNPRLLVLACNTASVLALEPVRARLPVPVVGVVPAVKPACESTRTGTIGVLATERTVAGRYLDDLIRTHCGGCRVVRCAAGDLVRYVETEIHTSGARNVESLAEPFTSRFLAAGVDVVVLGCTHFVYLKESLSALLGGESRVIDSRDGVARQVARVVGLRGSACRRPSGRPPRLFVTETRVPDRYLSLAADFAVQQTDVL